MKPTLPKIRCTAAQKMALIDYMWDHRRLARYEYDQHTADIEWFRLAETLNQNGSIKTVDKWKVTWRDLKRKALREVQAAVQNNTTASKAAMKIREILMSIDDGNPREHRNLKMSPSPHSSSIHLTPEDSYQGVEMGDQDQIQCLEAQDRSANDVDTIECTPDFSSDSSPSLSPVPRSFTKSRSNQDQINALVECMCINTDMAFGPQQTPKKIADWKRLRQFLNRMGPAKRTAAWQHSWRDLKRNALERNNTISKHNSVNTLKIVQLIEAHAKGTKSSNDVSANEDLHLSLPSQAQQHIKTKTVNEATSNLSPEQSDVSTVNVVPLRQITRCTNAQKHALVDYMNNHPALATSRFTAASDGDARYAEWRQLSRYLNNIGTAKSTISWKRTWRDLKLSILKKKWSNETLLGLDRQILDSCEKDPIEEPQFDSLPDPTDGMPVLYLQSPKHTKPDIVLCNPSHDDPANQESENNPKQCQKSPGNVEMSPGERRREMSPDQRSTQSSIHSDRGFPVQNGNGNRRDSSYEKNRRVRCTPTQINALVDYMERWPSLARARCLLMNGQDPHYNEWRRLCRYLNNSDTSVAAKSVTRWKCTWRTLVLNARRRECKKSRWYDRVSRRILQILNENDPGANETNVEEHVTQPNEDYIYAPSLSQSVPPDPLKCEPSEDVEHSREENAELPKRLRYIKRSSNLQMRALADFMMSHPDLAKKRPSENRPAWVKITRHLNSIGPIRSMNAWYLTWKDLKVRVHSRAHAKNKKAPHGILQGVRERQLRKLLGVMPSDRQTDPDTNIDQPATDDGETVAEYDKPESEVAVAPSAPSPRTVLYSLAEILARNIPMNEKNTQTKKSTPETSVSNDTNDILRELVLELKRSNDLKAEQNCHLKDILQQLKIPTCTHASQHTNIPINDTQTDIDVLGVQKQEDTLEDNQNFNEVANEDGKVLLMPNNIRL